MAEILDRLGKVATKEEIEHLVLRNLSRGSGDADAVPWQHLKYSFAREEFVHPLIVQELNGWLADLGQPVVAVDIGLANRSNRFQGPFEVEHPSDRPSVMWRGANNSWFSYSFVAASPSGVQIIESYESGGGTGIFGRVSLFAFQQDRCLVSGADGSLEARNRLVLKILGQVSLGDRYSGEIKYDGGTLMIGPDSGLFSRGDEASAEIQIR